jgi:hypothetical protein
MPTTAKLVAALWFACHGLACGQCLRAATGRKGASAGYLREVAARHRAC